jgi:osmoprotectant transport system permease protein
LESAASAARYTAASVGIAAAIAIPLGIFIGHTGRGSFLVIGVSNAARAIPTLGLLVLVVLLLGTGVGPIIGVLAVLALPPHSHRHGGGYSWR